MYRTLLLSALGMLAGAANAGDFIFKAGMDEPIEGPYNRYEAARFLNQATFGATLTEIDRLQRIGYNAWLDEQLALPASQHLPFLDNLIAQIPAGQSIDVWQDKRQEIWFKNALSAPDQLRQRMAYALSQIFVVSDQNGGLEGNPTTLAHYYDQLTLGAFGNYRPLLGSITTHPSMGTYLSSLGNRKEVGPIRPDENYAREIMQLFSIGLVQLNMDGSVVDGNSATSGIQPVPTYNQDTIRNFARVFTGWNYSTCEVPNAPNQTWKWQYCPSGPNGQDWRSHAGWRTPMKPWGEGTPYESEYHDTAAKTLLNGATIAAGTNARTEMSLALDNIAAHQNVAPFLSKLLIQRFTTSNPSPAYVNAVATAFKGTDNSLNFGRAIRTILMHPEARSGRTNVSNLPFGKIREPILRVTGLWRAYDARSNDNRIREGWPEYYAAQAAMRSPTVFNFYLPGYALPGPIANANLVSPEFQITTDTYITRINNELFGKINWAWFGNTGLGTWDPVQVQLNRDMAIAGNSWRLVDRIDMLFMGGKMPQPMFDALVTHVNGLDMNASWEGPRLRVQDALWLTLTSPAYILEK